MEIVISRYSVTSYELCHFGSHCHYGRCNTVNLAADYSLHDITIFLGLKNFHSLTNYSTKKKKVKPGFAIDKWNFAGIIYEHGK